MEHHTTDTHVEPRGSVPGKRYWLMIVGCTLPLAAVLLLPMFGLSWGTSLLFLLVLACPLMHLFGMHGGHHQPGTGDESIKER